MQATAHFVLWSIVLELVIGFGLALLINRRFRGHSLWTTIILLPMMLSPAVVGNFWTFLFQPQIGLFNNAIAVLTGTDPSSFQMIGDVGLAPWSIILVDTWMWTPYVMLICLAGLRSIPDYIYEAAEVDRASPLRQFWSITLPLVMPFLMLAILFRAIENFKMFDMVNLLTSGGPGSTTEVASITLKREAFEKWRTGYSSALAIILPLFWIFRTGFKTPPDSIAYPPKILFEPSVEGYVNLFTTRSRQTPEFLASLPPPQTWYERLVRSRNMVIGGPSKVMPRFVNSMVIGFGSTFLAVCFGTIAAYAFSRFRVPLADDLLFFILSTRMMPPIAVAIPIYLMFRHLGLTDTKLGMILLYTAVNVSLAVWLLKGFMDEIPREYEEAAMVDGYTRLQAFFKVVLPQATTGIAATAIFCLIFAWNEYAFAVLLTSGDAQTMPPFIPFIIGEGGQDWPAVAAATTLFFIPILCFTILLRRHLLRGITFGAVRK